MSKTATRRASGRSAEELQAAVERFLKASQKPALLEPGEEMIPLASGNFAMEARNSRLTLQAWDDRRNVVRRVVDIRESTPGRLELVAERFAGKRGALFLLDLARPARPGLGAPRYAPGFSRAVPPVSVAGIPRVENR